MSRLAGVLSQCLLWGGLAHAGKVLPPTGSGAARTTAIDFVPLGQAHQEWVLASQHSGIEWGHAESSLAAEIGMVSVIQASPAPLPPAEGQLTVAGRGAPQPAAYAATFVAPTALDASPGDQPFAGLPPPSREFLAAVAESASEAVAPGGASKQARSGNPLGFFDGRRPVKVLQLIDDLDVGGASGHAIDLSRSFRDDPKVRWDATLTVIGRAPKDWSMADMAREQGVEPLFIPAPRKSMAPWKNIPPFLRLLKLMADRKPAVVHTHVSRAGALGQVAAWLSGVPVRVHTFHGHVFRGHFGPWKSAVIVWLERLLALLSNRIVAVSPRVKEDLVRLKIAPARKIDVIRLGIDLERFSSSEEHRGALRRELGIGAGQPIVAIVARLVPVKAVPLFLQAARIIARRIPQARFVVVGDGPLRAALEAETRRLGLAESVHFLGFRHDLETIYPDIDVLTLTSHSEGSPVSLIEGLAAARAAVATDVGGVADVIRNGETGLLVPAGDVSAIAAAVIRLIESPQERRALGQAGQADVLRRFTRERMSEETRALYRRIWENARPPRASAAGPGP